MPNIARRGITLLEMLLVLAIAGMAMALSLQVLAQYQRAQTAAIRHERAGREFARTEQWFRSAVQGLAPTKRDRFKGSVVGWIGATLAPVTAPPGTPTLHHWRIQGTAQARQALLLEEAGTEMRLSTRAAASLRFLYMDGEGELHEQWPPVKGEFPQLPSAILLEMGQDNTRPRLIVAAVSGSKNMRDEPFEFDQDW